MPEVGAVEAGSESEAVLQAQLLHHVMLYTLRGCGSQRQQGHLGEPAHGNQQLSQLAQSGLAKVQGRFLQVVFV